MAKTVKAQIYWTPEAEGGRTSIPNNFNYSTVACFEDIKEKYPREAWSVVVDLEHAKKESRWVTVDFRFLAENAPEQLLYKCSKFKLFEGYRLVATGEVL